MYQADFTKQWAKWVSLPKIRYSEPDTLQCSAAKGSLFIFMGILLGTSCGCLNEVLVCNE